MNARAEMQELSAEQSAGHSGKVSIAICSSDRVQELERTLGGLATALPSDRAMWEVVVVLNGGRDDSESVARRFAQRLPLTVAYEPRPGLSHARNRAIAAASGEYILWIDDDVDIGAACLEAYRAGFRERREADLFAGPIRAAFDPAPPEWIGRGLAILAPAFAITGEHRDGERITRHALPFGANFAVRRSVQRRYLYDPALGRAPVGWLRGGEDTDVAGRMLADGIGGVWLAGARVDHRIGADRQTVAYLRRYFEGYGRTVGLMRRRSAAMRPWRRAPIDLLAVVAADMRFLAARLFMPPERWAPRLVKSAVRRGLWKANFCD